MTDYDIKKIILARRARFIAAALAAGGAVAGCSDSTDSEATVCLSISLQDAAPFDADAMPDTDAMPDACLTDTGSEAMMCLQPMDSGLEPDAEDADNADVGLAEMCLSPALEDSGSDGANDP
jgi:hypothetical protein